MVVIYFGVSQAKTLRFSPDNHSMKYRKRARKYKKRTIWPRCYKFKPIYSQWWTTCLKNLPPPDRNKTIKMTRSSAKFYTNFEHAASTKCLKLRLVFSLIRWKSILPNIWTRSFTELPRITIGMIASEMISTIESAKNRQFRDLVQN